MKYSPHKIGRFIMKFKTTMVALGIATAISGSAQAGSIYLTGHDVLFHGG